MKNRFTKLLESREFISVATCDFKGKPNAAPKFLLKIEDNQIFLIDYVIGSTWQNIKINPRVSLSFVDTNTLIAYQINGPVEIIEKGTVYDLMMQELELREIDLSTKRIIEGVGNGKVHEGFEVALPEKVVIFKVTMEEIVEIGSNGVLNRQVL